MSRVGEYLRLVDEGEGGGIAPGDPVGDALLRLLVHMACSDGIVEEAEFRFLERCLPGKDAGEILAWVAEVASQPLDLAAVGAALGAPSERARALEFTARMAWSDDELATRERLLLVRIAAGLGLPDASVEQALASVRRQVDGNAVPERIEAAALGMTWTPPVERTALFDDDLAAVVPDDAALVARLVVDGQEAVGLYETGLAARWSSEGVEAPAFLPFADIRRYSRVPTLGAAVRIETKDGKVYTLGDPRLRDVGALLDRIWP